MSDSAFGPVARHYDDLMASIPYAMWLDYVRLLFAYQGVRPVTVLDVCCGTGTICEMMREAGYRPTGIDLSPGMIAQAQSKAAEKGFAIDYHVADATCFELGQTFDAAISLFDSLNYITTAEGLRCALTQVAKHLRPGGSLVFDLNTAYAFEQEMFTQEDMRKRAKVRYRWTSDWDPATRLIRVHMKFWVGEESFEETHTQRAHPLEEVEALLRETGFEQIRSYHSYTLDPVRARSDRVHFAAIRR